jgi:hypothetical protein
MAFRSSRALPKGLQAERKFLSDFFDNTRRWNHNVPQAILSGQTRLLFRVQDRVAAEVVQAYSQAQTAEGRIRETEAELPDAQTLVRENLAALGQTQRLGEGGPILLVTRPLES